MPMGVPRVVLNSVPDCICTRSFSLRYESLDNGLRRGSGVNRTAVVRADCPGLRRDNCTWMSSSVRRMPGRLTVTISAVGVPGGQFSTMQPTLLQCDSPYVVTRKIVPNDDISQLSLCVSPLSR